MNKIYDFVIRKVYFLPYNRIGNDVIIEGPVTKGYYRGTRIEEISELPYIPLPESVLP